MFWPEKLTLASTCLAYYHLCLLAHASHGHELASSPSCNAAITVQGGGYTHVRMSTIVPSDTG